MKQVDEIIFPRWLIPVDGITPSPDNMILEDHGLVIDKGKIIALAPRHSIITDYTGNKITELAEHALLPGLVNSHTHAAMTLLRGYVDDLPLMQWLSEYIWPAESQWVSREFIKTGTDLAIAEMIRGGTTCFNDMYFYPDVTAARAETAGIRASVGMIVIDFPTVWAQDADEYINKGLEVRDDYRHSKLVSTAFAPHAPYTVSDQPLERIRTLADELECQIHMHVHETAHEIEESTARYGMRPLERLDQLGLLSSHLAAVHMTQILPAEIQTIAERGINLIHCPQSNLKLASGMCPVDDLLKAGVNLAIGTDGASSNNDLDMFSETQTASLLAKGVAKNPASMNAYQSLYAATLAGAISMGLDQVTGSIEPEKQADLIAIDLSGPSTQPVFNPLSQIIYSASRDQVSDVWIGGKKLLTQGLLTQMNLAQICADADQWGLKIKSTVGSNQPGGSSE